MGRHSVPDDYDDEAPAVLSAPPAPAGRPRPGRHAPGERPDPYATPSGPAVAGLDVIETVMADDTVEAVDADGTVADPAFEGHTEQIEPIADPVLDEPVPAAVTAKFAPVVDAATPPPRPAPRLGPQPGAAASPPADDNAADPAAADPTPGPGGFRAESKAAKAESKAAKMAGKAASKADSKAAKAASKADSKAAKAASEAEAGAAKAAVTRDEHVSDTTTPAADTRVSDLALLRTDSAARARVIAAIVVPFLLYVGVLLVLDALDLRTALIWIWVPLISAGVVGGLLLDLAHRAAAARAVAALEGEPAAADSHDATGPIVQR